MADRGRRARLAARICVPAAMLAATTALTALPAHAGAGCVTNKDAAVYEQANPFSKVVSWLDAGAAVDAGTSGSEGMMRAQTTDGRFLGYMRTADLNCSGG